VGSRRAGSLLAASAVFAASLVGVTIATGVGRAGADTTATPTQCVTAVAPVTIVNASKPLTTGKPVTAALPKSVPVDALAVVLQIRTDGAKPGELTLAPSSASTQRTPAINVQLNTWNAGTVVVNAPGTSLSALYTAAGSATGTAEVTAVVVGFIANQPCYTTLVPAAAVDTATGTGITAGALATSTPTPFTLQGANSLPTTVGASILNVHLTAGSTATTVSIQPADNPTSPVAVYSVAAKDTLEVTAVLPPSADSNYTVTSTTAGANLRIVPIGYFSDANAYAQSSDLLLDNKAKIGTTKVHLYSGAKFTFKIPADIPNPAAIVVSLGVTPLAPSALVVYPSSATKPTIPTGNYAKGRAGYQQVLLSPGTASSVTISVTAGEVDLVATVSGWVPFPPAVNQLVPGVTTIPSASQISVATPDASGNVSASYSGPDQLNIGDVVVLGVTADTPDGYLGVVTNSSDSVPASGAVSTQAAIRAADNTMPSTQAVELRPGSLLDALPNADMDSANLPVDSGTPPPDDSIDPPPDTPPVPTNDPVNPPSSGSSAAPRAAGITPNTSSGGSLPSKTTFKCSASAGISITTSLNLHAGLNLTGSWSILHGASANFGFSGGLTGSISLNADAGASCSFKTTLPGPPLPTITFSVGPVPVVVHPAITMEVDASASTNASIHASAGMDIGLDTGVKYDHGSWSSYFTPHSSFPVSVDSKVALSANAMVAVKPKLSLKIYGAAGPFAELGAFANATLQNSNPWWSASAGITADVGLSLDLWFIHASIDIGERNVATFSAGHASSPFPVQP
jgi:hypothetical protein